MYITPNWPAPKNIKAFTTIRNGGVSQPPYDQFNLAEHVGDQITSVQTNRELLKKELNLTEEPIWINQTHSTSVIEANKANRNHEADASYTIETNTPCVVLTADCLPILLCNKQGTHIAAIHAGWRGLVNGIIENTLKKLNLPGEDILAWLGPAISASNFEVGNEVREQFLNVTPEAEIAFSPSPNQRWLADLYELAKIRLTKQHVTSIFGGDFCTYNDSNRFYSYRRDGSRTGRMASLIWISL